GVKSATDQFYELNKSVQLTGDAFQQAQKEYDNYKEALQQGLNVLRQVNGNQDLTLEKFLQQKVLLKELNPISNDFISSLS
ncbi:hypothetical protein OFB72_32260, partial [Escherichia coli]|nr:hypothetical protein [Escherichia coli]